MKLNEAAKFLNVHVKTLQAWDKQGVLVAYRMPTGRRYYTQEQLEMFLGKKIPKTKGKTIFYVRVSSHNQKDDLENQLQFLKQYAKENLIDEFEVVKDIGSGLNYDRKNWNHLLKQIEDGLISKVIVAHKDRFIRFGFEWFEEYLKRFNCELVVVNNPKLSPQEEVIQDLISIIHVFSCKIYGLRKYKDKIKNDSELNPNSITGDLFCGQLEDNHTN